VSEAQKREKRDEKPVIRKWASVNIYVNTPVYLKVIPKPFGWKKKSAECMNK